MRCPNKLIIEAQLQNVLSYLKLPTLEEYNLKL
jgi:hypothetical protein